MHRPTACAERPLTIPWPAAPSRLPRSPGPSAQAEVMIDAKGRKRRLYNQWQTPFEKLLSLDRPQQFLRPGLSLAALKRVAATMSDTEAARRMQQAKNTMFEQIRRSA